MTWTAPEIHPVRTLVGADERPMLQSWLDFHRDTLLAKCGGLDAGQLATRSVPPSTLSLLGLVRHLTEVERGWFRTTAAGENLTPVYGSEAEPDADFDDLGSLPADQAFAAFRAEVAACDAAVADLSLDHTFTVPWRSDPYTLRWVYLHMIEEYARHNGHADLLRERIDGVTGS
ncbi:DinB family protein [Nocardia neocaledoniensis]|uniref:DinB family protein n=1 Tax=Nocardia neocaledoniensis TaxID=236511 RepID=UPI002454CF3D|nr:DinB family protein [Nocardia neocaledoniensis]